MPLATRIANDSTTEFVLASTSTVPGTLAVPVKAPQSSSLGLYFALACSASGLYADPGSGACVNASDPASFLCAFGSGDNCRICPIGCLCPGGARCWSRPGYYSAAENSPSVVACPPPQSRSRCLGWAASAATTQCGVSYLQGSFLCTACAKDFYAVGDGTCAACPVLAGKLILRLVALFCAFIIDCREI